MQRLVAHNERLKMDEAAAHAMQYLAVTDAMGYKAGPALLSPEEYAAELRKDAIRLDFVLRVGLFIVWTDRDGSIRQCQAWAQDEDENHIVLSGGCRFFNSEREAIDAAMLEPKRVRAA